MKKVAVIGAGYVGLVTAACLAQKNNIVTVIERDLQKITSLLKMMGLPQPPEMTGTPLLDFV